MQIREGKTPGLARGQAKRAWQAPGLRKYGRLRELVAAGSGNMAEGTGMHASDPKHHS